MKYLFAITAWVGMVVSMQKATAQSFRLMRYDEDYSYLQTDTARHFYQRLKYMPLGSRKSFYVSLGGEMRYEYAAFNNEDWGKLHIGHNNFLLQRYDLHADVHLGNRLRVFAQLRSALENGRKTGPRPIDEDQLNVQNLFADLQLWKRNKQSITLRAGRQEIDYGTGRLISVREGPNARLYFTGGKLMYVSSRVWIDGFVFMADSTYPGVFDNKGTRQANLWGSYAKWIIPKAGNLDWYYLGIHRNNAVFEEGMAKETRHTLGIRWWKYGGGFIYNLEGAYQWGRFGAGGISAWTASADIGYLFETLAWKPSINLRNDYISGDRHAGDGSLQTFNPLYPKGGYFGFDPQIGPANLVDIHPYLTASPTQHLSVQADVVFNWRYSLQDGVYRPGGSFNLAGAGSAKRYIGTAYLASAVYSFSRFVALNFGMQYFHTGGFINDVVPAAKNGLFINTRLGFKF